MKKLDFSQNLTFDREILHGGRVTNYFTVNLFFMIPDNLIAGMYSLDTVV